MNLMYKFKNFDNFYNTNEINKSTPTVTPSPDLYEQNNKSRLKDVFIKYEENIKLQDGQYIFSNGYLKWINGIATYIMPTEYYDNKYQINIYYSLYNNGPIKYGYYDENEQFIELVDE
jgi:hypothetical protein